MDAFVQDRVERRRFPARRLEDLTNTVLEVSPVPIFVKDAAGRFTLVNSAAAELFGRSVEELLGKTEFELLPLETAQRHADEDREVLDDVTCFLGEETLQGIAAGRAGTFLTRKVCARDARGAPLVVTTMTDVRALKVAEQEARSADERDARTTAILHSVLDSSEAAIFSVDREYRYTSFNAAQAAMVRELYGTDAVLGRRLDHGLPSDVWLETKALIDRALTGDSFVQDLVNGERVFEVSYRPVRDPAENVTGVAVFLRETTERRRAEAALEASEERLRQAQKMDAVGRLAGGVAHDLNNMLTVVLSSVSFMQTVGANSGPFARDLEEIAKAADRARALTAQLLSFSRKQPVNPVVFDVNAKLQDLSQMLKRIIGEDITMTLDLGPTPGPVSADPGAFDQALMNLIVNARDAMPKGGTITIRTGDAVMRDEKLMATSCRSERTHTMISVIDTGHGMSAEVLEHLFEPFFTTKERGKGTGLGLAIVYGAIRQAHGVIDVKSREGVGSTFTIYLPIAKSAPTRPTELPEQVNPARPGEHVLLVEDDPQVQSAAARALERFGYRVSVAASLSEAVSIARREASRLSALVTDVVLPEKDGIEVFRSVCQVSPGLPVLFMSGFPEDVVREHGLPPGAAMLQKPFTPEGLAKRVRQVIDAAVSTTPMPAARNSPVSLSSRGRGW